MEHLIVTAQYPHPRYVVGMALINVTRNVNMMDAKKSSPPSLLSELKCVCVCVCPPRISELVTL